MRVNVPLDRTGRVPGTVPLYVERAAGRGSGTIFALAGGPGQAGTTLTGNFASDLSGSRSGQLIVLDQRGTGKSGLLNCPELERQRRNDTPLDGRAAVCARRLGERRHLYTTRDSVEDIEAVRRRIGVGKISLLGVSYGTKVALAYALRYPANVERLVLDSVVAPEGQDIFDLDTFAAMPRVLREICRGECARVTPDPAGDVATLVDRMAVAPLRGAFYDSRGRARQVSLTRRGLYDMIRAGDGLDELRIAYPAAVRSAVEGDPAPLLRLEHRFDESGARGPEIEPRPQDLSVTLSTATLCEETPLPWERTTPFAQRPAAARAAAAAVPDARFEPFDRATTLASRGDTLTSCMRWLAAPEAPALGPGPLPDVPVLVLEGAEDLRTPLEVGARVAARFARSEVVAVPKTAHAVLGRAGGCAELAVRRFFAGQAVGNPCAARRRGARVLPKLPARLSDVPAAPGVPGQVGRTLAAVGLTLRDLYSEYDQLNSIGEQPAGGGLRGGRFRVRGGALVAEGFTLVPGVRVGARVGLSRRPAGTVTVSGPVAGTLALSRAGRLTGMLGGRRVALSLGRLR
ncbi:MAG: hypothetical protein QOI91_1772 [Solirubrobacteraceae bacterium]|jgi:pimeloyl-ACP methyl ester carboxylesterase|nr:hypothetical protein [Solirubrobacteraceae bacterium]